MRNLVKDGGATRIIHYTNRLLTITVISCELQVYLELISYNCKILFHHFSWNGTRTELRPFGTGYYWKVWKVRDRVLLETLESLGPGIIGNFGKFGTGYYWKLWKVWDRVLLETLESSGPGIIGNFGKFGPEYYWKLWKVRARVLLETLESSVVASTRTSY